MHPRLLSTLLLNLKPNGSVMDRDKVGKLSQTFRSLTSGVDHERLAILPQGALLPRIRTTDPVEVAGSTLATRATISRVGSLVQD